MSLQVLDRIDEDYVLDPNLVFYLPNKEFGLSAVDGKYYCMSSDHYGHLIENNGSTWQLNSRRFDGDDWWNIDKVLPALASTKQGTWMCWVKLDDASIAATYLRLIAFGDTDVLEEICIYVEATGKLYAQVYKAGANQWALDTNAIAFSDGVYAHVALIQDGVSPVILVNGVKIAQTFQGSTDKTAWFSVCTGLDNGRFGCSNRNGGGNANFIANGNLAKPKIFSRAMSIGEVQQCHYLPEKEIYR